MYDLTEEFRDEAVRQYPLSITSAVMTGYGTTEIASNIPTTEELLSFLRDPTNALEESLKEQNMTRKH
jgi:hypothetical protein